MKALGPLEEGKRDLTFLDTRGALRALRKIRLASIEVIADSFFRPSLAILGGVSVSKICALRVSTSIVSALLSLVLGEIIRV